MAKPIDVSGSVDVAVSGGPTRLYGYSLSTGTVGGARAFIRNSKDALGIPVVVVNLAERESETVWLDGLDMDKGIYVDITLGTLDGSIYV